MPTAADAQHRDTKVNVLKLGVNLNLKCYNLAALKYDKSRYFGRNDSDRDVLGPEFAI